MSNAIIDNECTTTSAGVFNTKINNWAEGTLLTIDADHAKITIRGAKRPYASEYAKMLIAIHEATADMTQVDRSRQTTEIRQNWKSALEVAHAQPADAASDMTFQLPGKDTKLVVVDESSFYNRDTKIMTALSAKAHLTDTECKSVHALKDLKVGECVVVGYESGMLRNDGYVVIKGNCATK